MDFVHKHGVVCYALPVCMTWGPVGLRHSAHVAHIIAPHRARTVLLNHACHRVAAVVVTDIVFTLNVRGFFGSAMGEYDRAWIS